MTDQTVIKSFYHTMIAQRGKVILGSCLKVGFNSKAKLNPRQLVFPQKPNPTMLFSVHQFRNINLFLFSTALRSIAQLQKQVELIKRNNGENSVQYLHNLQLLAEAYANNQKVQKAIQIMELVVKKIEAHAPYRMAPIYGFALKNLQRLYKIIDKFDGIISVTKKLIEITKMYQERKEMADEMNELALAYAATSNVDEAIDTFRAAMKIQEDLSGKASVAILEMREQLATVFMLVNSLEKAKAMFEENIASIMAMQNFHEQLYTKSTVNLAFIALNQGQFRQALTLFEKSVDLVKVSSQTNYLLEQLYLHMAIAALNLDQLQKCQEYQKLAYTVITESHRQIPFSVATNYYQLGEYYQRKGQLQKSLESYRKSVQIGQKSSEKSQTQLRQTYKKMGFLLRSINENSQAKMCFQKVLETMRNQNSEEDQNILSAEMHQNIGALQKKENKNESAMEHFKKAEELFIKFLGEGNIQLAETYFGMAQCYFVKQDHTEGHKYIDKSIQIYERLNPSSPNLHLNYSFKGQCYMHVKKFPEAIQYLQKSIVHLEQKAIGYPQETKQSNIANITYMIGEIYWKSKDLPKAIEIFRKAVPMLEKTWQENDFQALMVYKEMAEKEKILGNQQEEMKYRGKMNNIITGLQNFISMVEKKTKFKVKAQKK